MLRRRFNRIILSQLAGEPQFVLIDRTAGTNIGDLTAGGGLAAAFDGTTDQAYIDCAVAPSSGQIRFVGKTLAAPRIFGKALVYGSNNFGFFYQGNNTTTLRIYGKQGAAPATGSDGTLIGETVITDTSNESAGRQIDSTDLVTAWDHIWFRVSNGSGGTVSLCCAELVLYAWEIP